MKAKRRHSREQPPNSKFSVAERERVKERVAYLERMGYPQVEIAKDVGVSQPQVSMYLTEIKERYNAGIIEERKIWVQRELAVLMDVRRKAVDAMEQAKKGKRKKKVESGSNERGGFDKVSREKEQLLPPSEYMAIIIKTDERVCAILGLEDAPKNVFNVNVEDNRQQMVVTPESLLATILANRKPSAVEDKLKEVEEGTG